MASHSIAIRYARALFEVSVVEADPKEVGRDLDEFARLLVTHETLGKVLLNPAVSTLRKRAIVSQITERAGKITPAVARLLVLLAERGRFGILPQVVEAYAQRLMAHLNTIKAEVTTTEPLLPDRIEAIRKRLVALTGQEVSLVTNIKPAILGGAITRIGGTVYDGSIARQLERMKGRLLEST